ncbi:MAG: type II toxin-antitoxin system PemK/MazF family toxin [Actinomycetaceae bacterium]|nr:type II toxin-antitoxin system PemK/MazF family toxin [Actinomycetaceae bacterium]
MVGSVFSRLAKAAARGAADYLSRTLDPRRKPRRSPRSTRSSRPAHRHPSKPRATREHASYFVSDHYKLPRFDYAPRPNGAADPGEVVWAWVPYEEDYSRGKDRPVLVLADVPEGVLCAQMTSKDHDRDAAQEARWGRYWMDIGTGEWDHQRRPSEVRLDRLVIIPRSEVRREGGKLDRGLYLAVTGRIRQVRARQGV